MSVLDNSNKFQRKEKQKSNMANKIEQLRKARGLSMNELAKASGVNRSTIFAIEKIEDIRKSKCGISTIANIAESLGVSLVELLDTNPINSQRRIQSTLEKRIAQFNKKKITMLKNIAKTMKVKITIEDDEQ